MKNIYKSHILLWVLTLLFFVSCDDEAFLTESPETFYTIDNVYSSSEQVNQVITNCYYILRDIYMPYDNYSDLDVWSYSRGNGTDVFDVPTIRYSYRFNDYSIISSETDVFYATYTVFYKLINAANTALYAAELDGISWDSEEDLAYVQAQARFFRALAYRNLGELFGGVPLVEEITTTLRYDYVRATRMETYQYAIDEMEAILDDLPETITEAGRIVKAAAQHNLCQLYLDQGVLTEDEGGDGTSYFNTALSYANTVIDGGTYSLMTSRFGDRSDEDPVFYYASSASEQTSDRTYLSAGYEIKGNLYWDLWQVGNQDYQDGNTEAIWCGQSDYDVFKENGDHASLSYPMLFGPVWRDQGGDIITGQMEDCGGYGCCQITPTSYARDSIYSGKWADDLRNSEAVFRRIVLGNISTSEYFGKQVPWDVIYKTVDGEVTDAAYTLLYPMSCKIAPDIYTAADGGSWFDRLLRDDYFIRLPETILLRAEIQMRLGNDGAAASDINLLRSRAQCGYMVTASDVGVDLILDERARELIYEESRWNTLLRMGGTVACDRIKKYSYWDYPRNTLTADYNVWPIPQTVIDVNVGVEMEQNDPW